MKTFVIVVEVRTIQTVEVTAASIDEAKEYASAKLLGMITELDWWESNVIGHDVLDEEDPYNDLHY